jgi:transcriptional regulator with XRE-family HTH domain
VSGSSKGGPVLDVDAFKRARLARNWTVDELSLVSGVAATSIRRWESAGPRRAQIDFLAAAARALQVDIASLVVEPVPPGLRDYRYRAGLTVEGVAVNLGVSMTLISQAEVGMKLSDRLAGLLATVYPASEDEIRAAYVNVRESRIKRLLQKDD